MAEFIAASYWPKDLFLPLPMIGESISDVTEEPSLPWMLRPPVGRRLGSAGALLLRAFAVRGLGGIEDGVETEPPDDVPSSSIMPGIPSSSKRTCASS